MEKISVACQTEPNLIDKLINNHTRKPIDEVDLYQEYMRSAQCEQFWPLDKNPIRSLVPTMIGVNLPEQHLKNESLMFDLVQAITNNAKLVNLLAKYIHHIVPNVIISKRIDLIPLITCTIRVCRDTSEQERLISLLFNLIKRPNEEQRRMILSGIIVVLQVSPNQSSSLLLPNLWDHVNDKFPERRILLAESCAPLAHYVRPIMRTNLILSILIQLLKDKNAAVRSAACKSFACLLSLIMDRDDKVFDACLSATEDIIQDVLGQTPVNFCENRYELEQMRFCALETVYPLLCMWAVKLNRFKVELAEFYLAKAERCFASLINKQLVNGCLSIVSPVSMGNNHDCDPWAPNSNKSSPSWNMLKSGTGTGAKMAEVVAKRRSIFFESRHSSWGSSASSGIGSLASSSSFSSTAGAHLRRQSAFVGNPSGAMSPIVDSASQNGAILMSQRAISAYLKMLSYLIPFVFSDTVHSCAWLSKSKLNIPSNSPLSSSEPAPPATKAVQEDMEPAAAVEQCKSEIMHAQEEASIDLNNNNHLETNLGMDKEGQKLPMDRVLSSLETEDCGLCDGSTMGNHSPKGKPKFQATPSSVKLDEKSMADNYIQLFDRPLKFCNKLLEPSLIIDELAIVAFHDQLEQDHMIESVEWILCKFLPKYLSILTCFSCQKFSSTIACGTAEIIQEFLSTIISSIRQLCLLFGKHLTRTKIRPLIRAYIENNNVPALYFLYIASLTSFEPIEQQEYEEIVSSIREILATTDLSRNDVELLALSIKIIAKNNEQIHSPSTRQKFLTYILDALVNYSNQTIRNNATASATANHRSSATKASSKLSFLSLNKSNGSSILSSANSKQPNPSSRNNNTNRVSNDRTEQQQQTQTKEFMLIIFRHILTCLIDPSDRPSDWAHILVTKFLPLIIKLANDSTDVHVCTYARLMCAQLVETFDTYLNSPELTKQAAETMMPALQSLKSLTDQIKASNLKRQIESLIQDVSEKFFNDENISNSSNSSSNQANNM